MQYKIKKEFTETDRAKYLEWSDNYLEKKYLTENEIKFFNHMTDFYFENFVVTPDSVNENNLCSYVYMLAESQADDITVDAVIANIKAKYSSAIRQSN